MKNKQAASHPQFRRWLRAIEPGFYTHCSWSWRLAGVLVTHWGNDLVKIYHDGGRSTVCYPAQTEGCREAVQELLSLHRAGVVMRQW